MSLVFKIVSAAEWKEATSAGAFRGSAIDLKDGFIVLGVNPKGDEDATYFEKEWSTTGQHFYR